MKKNNLELSKKIKKYLIESKKSIVLVISGANGAGKTTLAFHLSNLLEIKQRVGLGSIVKTLIVLHPKNKYYSKMNNYFHTLTNKDIEMQSAIISKIVNFIIEKYHKKGVSCIIEGVQLYTRFLDKECLQFHIQIDDIEKYKEQLSSHDNSAHREITDVQFQNLLKLNSILGKEMVGTKAYILKNANPLNKNINEVLKQIINKLNIE